MGYAGYTPPEQDIRAADGQPYATGKDEPHGGPYAPITQPEATR